MESTAAHAAALSWSMLIFEPFYTPGIAQLSYLIGDDAKGVAALIDPWPHSGSRVDWRHK